MLEEQAIVVAADGDHVWLEIKRRSSCGACAATGVCGTSLLGKWLSRRRLEVRAMNPIGARAGDWVVVGLADDVLSHASLVVYLMPLLGLILGAGAGQGLGGEPAAVLGGGVGFCSGLMGVARFAERRQGDPAYQAVILRRAVDLPQQVPFV